MSPLRFGLTYDYRCPFARNVHEHVLAGLGNGADWEVRFVPFSLSQVHVEEGEPAVWDDPARAPELLALAASVAVRERWPAQFLAVHRALFEARHDAGGDLRSAEVVAHALAGAGLEPDTVLAEVEAGWPAAQVRAEHEQAVSEHQVFGVPTFLVGSEAAFVRLMVRPGADPSSSRAIIEQLVTLVGQQTEINEVKHTSVPR
jgi:protein-disulfide isomerase-like protein with CxxC motif